MRAMSFMLTTQQVIDETKDVTRRAGWERLCVGDRLKAVEKCMGLKKGEKHRKLKIIEVVSIRREKLCAITREDVIREGFPSMSEQEFIAMFCKSHSGCTPHTTITRIEFKYVGDSE